MILWDIIFSMTADFENAYISSDISKGAKTFFYLGNLPERSKG